MSLTVEYVNYSEVNVNFYERDIEKFLTIEFDMQNLTILTNLTNIKFKYEIDII